MGLAHRALGDGPPLLLIHGGAEDAAMLIPQAEAFAAAGWRVISYDRRGTGASTRDGWPGSGADQHADDAAHLIRNLAGGRATVLGFSSGGVIALALAARHPGAVRHAVAWEPPALGVLPDGAGIHAGLVAPIEAYLSEHPRDWRGAYLVMLDVLSGGRTDPDAPAVARMSRNAEAVIRDDARLITRRGFVAGELPAERVSVAIGDQAGPLHVGIAEHLGALTGRPPRRVAGGVEHEVYLSRPEVMVEMLGSVIRAVGYPPAACPPATARG
jgi:pimeloyl-ACP methyl ester carboxylesterase